MKTSANYTMINVNDGEIGPKGETGSIGPKGETGAKGDKGDTGAVGQGVSSIIEEYNLSTSKTTPNGTWTTTAPTWSTGKYVWTRSKITYKNPTDTKYTTEIVDNSWEAVNEIEPTVNTSVKSTDVEYYLSTSNTSLNGGTWSTTAPTWVDGKYMWSRTKTTLNNGNVSYKPNSNGTCIVGNTTRSIRLQTNINVLNFSKRNGFLGATPYLVCDLTNIPLTNPITWNVSTDTVILSDNIDDTTGMSKNIDPSGLEESSVIIYVTTTYNGLIYSDNVILSKVFVSNESEQYIGTSITEPLYTQNNEELMKGDWYLNIDESSDKYGHAYEYQGKNNVPLWLETTDSAKLSMLVPDALKIAEETNRTVFVANLFAERIVANKINVAGEIQSVGYGEPDVAHGFHLDGVTGVIKADGAKLIDCDVSGSFTSDEFSTQTEENTQSYPSVAPAKTLWSQEDFYTNFPVSESKYLTSISGSWDGKTLVKANKSRESQYSVYYEFSYPPKSVDAIIGPAYKTTTIFSGTVSSSYGSELRLTLKTSLGGFSNWLIFYVYRNGTLIQRFSSGAAGEDAKQADKENFVIGTTVKAGDTFKLEGTSSAWWGSQKTSTSYLSYTSVEKHSGVVGFTSSYEPVEMIKPSTSKYHQYNYSLTSPSFNTNDFLTKRSGTSIVENINNLGTYVFVTGILNYEGETYSIDGVKRTGNTLTFRSGQTELVVQEFKDGTNIGVYSTINNSLFSVVGQLGGVQTKHVIPKDDNLYDIGQLGDGGTLDSWVSVAGDSSVGTRLRGTDGFIYKCITSQDSGTIDAQPIKGKNWDLYWELDTDQSDTKKRFRNGYFSGNVYANTLSIDIPTTLGDNNEGYFVLPNGLMVVYGIVRPLTTDRDMIYVLPYSFPNKIISCMATTWAHHDVTSYAFVRPNNKASIVYRCSSDQVFWYLCIGY